MNTHAAKIYAIAAIIVSVVLSPLYASDTDQQFQSDNRSLALTGVWVVHRNDGSSQLTVGMKYTGSAPLKACRAKLLKLNDFGEGHELFDIEYSSESKYLPGKGKSGKVESHHIIQPGNTIYFNVLQSSSGGVEEIFSEVSYFQMVLVSHGHSEQEAVAGVAEFRAGGGFRLHVTDLVPTEK